jgi:biopolymer transport protein ExbB
MIETFSSLSSAELHSSSGGIAGGISQALITTQFGLLVAIPGVFISKYLKKIERKTYLDALQLQDLICEHKEEK